MEWPEGMRYLVLMERADMFVDDVVSLRGKTKEEFGNWARSWDSLARVVFLSVIITGLE